MAADPYRALGLIPDPGLTDDDIRSAWHRVAAATHPDRADGGNPAAFSAAAAAYSDLRTPFGRGEALADLAGPRSRRPGRRGLLRQSARLTRLARAGWRPAGAPQAGPPAPERPDQLRNQSPGRRRRPPPATRHRRQLRPARPAVAALRLVARVRYGRPLRLATLLLLSAAICVIAVTVTGWQPASVALTVGAATWILRGGRRYLSAPPLPGPAAPGPYDHQAAPPEATPAPDSSQSGR